MSNLNLAVVGGGSGSYTMAGDFVLAGHKVRMWTGARQKHAELFRNGAILLEGLGRTGPYLTRKVEPTKVQVSGLAAHLPLGVFPACNTDRTFERVNRLYPAAHPVENALSVALLNVGPIIHSVLFLLNTGAIEHFPAWDIHNEGTTQSVKKLVLAHDAERIELRKALGYTSHHYPFEDHYDPDGDTEWMYGKKAHTDLIKSEKWRESLNFNHRYILEDVKCNLALMTSVGDLCRVETPIADSLLTLIGTISGGELQ